MKLFAGLLISIFSIVPVAHSEVHCYELQTANPAANDYTSSQIGTELCWAACAQTMLSAAGATINQPRIVASVKGIVLNAPASVDDLARSISGVGRDDNNQLVSGSCAVFRRDATGKLSFNHGTMNPLLLAYLMGYGVPTTMLYNPHGGTVGHFVVISGVSIDDQTMAAVTYRIEDPWPINAQGKFIGAHAASKIIPADELESSMSACLVPLIYTEVSQNRLVALIKNMVAIQQGAPLTFKMLDGLAGNNFQIANYDSDLDALDIINDNKAARSVKLVPKSDVIQWNEKNGTVDLALKYTNRGTRTIQCMIQLQSGQVARTTDDADLTTYEKKFVKNLVINIAPNSTELIKATLQWSGTASKMPHIRYPTNDEDRELLKAKFDDDE